MLLAEAARRMGIAEKLAAVIPDRLDPARVVHRLPEILLARILARVTETASRVRIAFASTCPEAVLFRYLAGSIRSGLP